ncbi:MAG TPA: hypothetical protein VN655_03825 [Pseudolabrys sp.]|nr:hypothetical protein [Pseudolabrys sp.]
MVLYALIRLILWSGAVGIALFPTVQVTGLYTILHSMALFAPINKIGHLRDLFFLVVPASAVSLSTTIDYLCAKHETDSALGALIALILNFLVLVSGFVGFLVLPGNTVVPGDTISLYSEAIVVGLVVSLSTELWLSGAAEKHREQERKAQVADRLELVDLRAQIAKLKYKPKKSKKEAVRS